MARLRVKAYFMHEHEEAAAHQAADDAVIESPEWTAGYVMGVVEEKQIPALRRKGLIVTPIEPLAGPIESSPTELTALEAGPFATRLAWPPVTASGTTVSTKRLPKAAKGPHYYIVRFHGALTAERKAVLRRLKVALLERVTRNRYTARLDRARVRALAKVEFVDWIRIYDNADALLRREEETGQLSGASAGEAVSMNLLSDSQRSPMAPRKRETAAGPGTKRPRMAVFSVRVHRRADLPPVMAWMRRRRIRPLWKGADSFRLALRSPGKDLSALARLPEVATIEELRVPRPLDEFAQVILGIGAFRQGPAADQLRGAGELIAIADTGLDDAHPDFRGRIRGCVALGRKGDTTDPEGHGTHVTGCVAGDGRASNGAVVGAAPEADIFFQSILDRNGMLGGLPADLGKLFKQAYTKGARIHNNSWGAFSFAGYVMSSLQVDRFVYEHPDMLIVIAAGNDGIAVPRGPDKLMNSVSGYVDWPSVAAPATAKNGLTVGASRNSRKQHGFSTMKWGMAWAERYPENPIAGETVSGDPDSLAAFSSRGPCIDQRIKPDVVAPGTDIAAARSKDAPLRKFWGAYPNNAHYGFMGGTSMAAPYVSGCAALVREWYRKEQGYAKPSAALIKATLINGARRIGGRDAGAPPKGDPNYHQGFGRINLETTLPHAGSSQFALAYIDTWTRSAHAIGDTGDRHRFSVKVGAGHPLRLCLVWTDPPARSLQNGLVLLVDDGQKGKWVGNSGVAMQLRVPGAYADPNNNVQVVRLPNPTAGTYTIAVTGENLLDPPQHYALVVTGALEGPLARS